MKLRVNARDYKLVEDEMGNPIFRFLGLHPSDLYEIIEKANGKADEMLQRQLDNALDKLEEIKGTTYEY